MSLRTCMAGINTLRGRGLPSFSFRVQAPAVCIITNMVMKIKRKGHTDQCEKAKPMFKHYLVTFEEVTCEYYVGATENVKALYKSIRRNKSTGLMPAFCGSPKFAEGKSVYALCIDENNYITIVNSDTMLSILIDRELDVQEV